MKPGDDLPRPAGDALLARRSPPVGSVGSERDAAGRFAAGNRGGPGNPQARRVARLRAELLRVVTPADVADVLRALVEWAKGGDVAAAKELLDRTIGKVRTETADRDAPDEQLPVRVVVRFDKAG